jgi:histidinol-phosphatase (PHP family)
MEEYVERALELPLGELGVSDHFPVYHLPEGDSRQQDYGMDFETLPEYMWRATELRMDYPEIPIRLGIEMDYVEGYEEQLEGWTREYPFDYVIGSVHFLGEYSIDDPRHMELYEKWPLDKIWREYFRCVQKAARSGFFDIIGHLDLVKKFDHYPPIELNQLYEETVEVLADSGVCVELNTGGLRAPVAEMYPSRRLLELCHEYGVPITLGSDAHRPGEVGYELELAVRLAQEVGYDSMTTFRERERQQRFFGG